MKKSFRLILVSFVILFLELLLIRLVETEVRIFAYLSNLILLAIFIGTGIGMLVKKEFSLVLSSVLLFAISASLISGLFSGITEMISPLSESFIWFQPTQTDIVDVIAGFFLTAVLFFAVMTVFIPLGQNLGRMFNNTNRLILWYSLNVAAGVAGMWSFYGLSLISISPYIGLAFGQILLTLLLENKKGRIVSGVLAILMLGIAYQPSIVQEEKTIWSPYQKLSLSSQSEKSDLPPGYLLKVNNVGYMGLLDLSNAYKEQVDERLANQELPKNFDLRFADQYELPFLFKPAPERVLIIGSGGGNDVAAALRKGADRIDAIEIDPKIAEFGKIYHPEKPYQSPKVNLIIDDGRSFFKGSKEKYDLVILGLADSHALTSSLTNVRLDNFLYTQESFSEIKKILKPDGVLAVSFDVRRPWVGARIKKGLADSFGRSPEIFNFQDINIFGWGGVLFLAQNSSGTIEAAFQNNPDFEKFINSRKADFNQEVKPLTDNWPYLYLDQPRLPKIHLIISALLFLFFLPFGKKLFMGSRFSWPMFFLGAGFLLYEFFNISRTGLLFGNTWTTNLFTITAILFFILLANFLHAKRPIPLKASFAGIILSLALQFIIPLDYFNSFNFFFKTVSASIVLNLPFFFSALAFIALFTLARERSAALASNLIGSGIGGILSFVSFLFGLSSLLIVSLIFYISAIFLLLFRERVK